MPLARWLAIVALRGVQAFAAGGDVTCASPGGAGAVCRGDASHGQLGDGALFRRAPVQAPGLP